MKLDHIKNVESFDFLSIDKDKLSKIILFESSVPAGFPSPADDYLDINLDLHSYLVQNPSSTFCVKVIGESMKGARIQSGDIMIVDRSLKPKNGSVVLAVIDSEFTVKRVKMKKNELYLFPENNNFDCIKITEEMDFQIWGVVTFVIHKAL
tara:strand:- start:168 stop:620 length:453 start_codon:yes stop_codon:yes gene_type:complete